MAVVEQPKLLVGMDFYQVCGLRRSVRWYKTWKPVEREKIQRILEVVRVATTCPGNLQPWKAVVVEQARIPKEKRDRLLYADNLQGAHVQAPVWIYWFGDVNLALPQTFISRVKDLVKAGALPSSYGWTDDVMEATMERGEEAPEGFPGVHELIYGMPAEVSQQVAYAETVGACAVACLAAVNEGLGTSLHMTATPSKANIVQEQLQVPDSWIPVWVQLVGYPAEDPEAGGQRPKLPFEELYFEGDASTAFERDSDVANELQQAGLIRPTAPTSDRFEELKRLAQMFGYPI
ncbi:MAG TPA: nitroreductase family protein [Candidatus Binatia bacterium]|jgi:nitroreductase|nr:nitroreductase family protein [Candidatus Binatia bacterium]